MIKILFHWRPTPISLWVCEEKRFPLYSEVNEAVRWFNENMHKDGLCELYSVSVIDNDRMNTVSAEETMKMWQKWSETMREMCSSITTKEKE